MSEITIQSVYDAQALGDRIAAVKQLLEWLRSLPITADEFKGLIERTRDLFEDFSIGGLIDLAVAFIDAFEAEGPTRDQMHAMALPIDVLAFIKLLLKIGLMFV